MAGLTLDMRLEGMEALLKKADPAILERPLRMFWGEALATLEAEAKKEAPVDIGPLRASLTGALETAIIPTWGAIGTNIKYAAAVHEGTRPHEIVPVRAKALAFQAGGKLGRGSRRWGRASMIGGGEMVIVRRVQHPGTKANPFLSRALGKAKGAIVGFLADALKEVEMEFNK